jgi:acylphosphatase
LSGSGGGSDAPGSSGSNGPIRVRVAVTGRVQGVWFRDRCQEEARAAGVNGFVRNRADGSVEAEFEGPPAAVERMIAWCHDGPPRARVEAVYTERIATVGEPGFRVR